MQARVPTTSTNSSARPATSGFAHEFVPSTDSGPSQKHDEAESAFYGADVGSHASIWDANLLAEELSVCTVFRNTILTTHFDPSFFYIELCPWQLGGCSTQT